MKNLFVPEIASEVIARIESLQADKKALWGKMNSAQMVAHCQVPMEVALGDKKIKRSLVGYLFGRIAKKSMYSDKPMPRNLPTDKTFVVPDERNLEVEKSRLIQLVKRFAEAGPTGLTPETHPFFGKLTMEEWGVLSYQHLDHHLRQFGV